MPIFDGNRLSAPSSWKLAPGHTPTNVGGLAWKFAATPADPKEERVPGEKPSIEQNNSQQDELCGVTGMSLVDAQATIPSGFGSCIAAGTPVKTRFEVTLGRPDVPIAELDSGIEWNNSGAMSFYGEFPDGAQGVFLLRDGRVQAIACTRDGLAVIGPLGELLQALGRRAFNEGISLARV